MAAPVEVFEDSVEIIADAQDDVLLLIELRAHISAPREKASSSSGTIELSDVLTFAPAWSSMASYHLRIDGDRMTLTPMRSASATSRLIYSNVSFPHHSLLDVTLPSPVSNELGSGRSVKDHCHLLVATYNVPVVSSGASVVSSGDDASLTLVTMALPSRMDCMRVACTLAHFQKSLKSVGMDSKAMLVVNAAVEVTPGLVPLSEASSMFTENVVSLEAPFALLPVASDLAVRTNKPLADDVKPKVVVVGQAAQIEKESGTSFGPLYVQAAATMLPLLTSTTSEASYGGFGCSALVGDVNAKVSSINDGPGYRLSTLQFSKQGISAVVVPVEGQADVVDEVVRRSNVLWSVPWAVVVSFEPVFSCQQSLRTHSYGCALTLTPGAGSMCHLFMALESETRRDVLLSIVNHHRRCGSASADCSGELPKALPCEAQPIVVATCGASSTHSAVCGNGEQNARASANPVSVESNTTTILVDRVPVVVPISIATLFASFRDEDTKQPIPLNLAKVWILVQPSFRNFQMCTLCVDKLGITLRPLVPIEALQENLRRGAEEVGANECIDFKGFALTTEMLHFPLSSIMDVSEEMEFVPPACPGNSLAASEPCANVPNVSQGCGSGPLVSAGRGRLAPFARASLQPPSASPGDDNHLLPVPPTAHFVGVRVKGALAGRFTYGGERVPAHMRLHAQPPPPVTSFLCFVSQLDANRFINKVLAYKRYQLAVAVRAHVASVTETSRRVAEQSVDDSSIPNDEVGAVLQRMRGVHDRSQVTLNTEASFVLSPPPLPARPPDLLPASRLPRMVSNDEGEVFWYIPKKPTQDSGSPCVVSPMGLAADKVPGTKQIPPLRTREPAGVADSTAPASASVASVSGAMHNDQILTPSTNVARVNSNFKP